MSRPPRPHTVIVGGWLNDLAVLTAGSRPLEEQKAKVAALTAVLADTFPDSALFGKDSLYAISRMVTFLPSFAELHRLLTDWQQAHRPKVFISPAELDTAGLSGEQRAIVDSWLRSMAGGQAPDQDLAIGLSVVRRYAESGFAWLVRNNATAGAIAARRGWVAEEAKDPTDYADPQRILASVRAILEPLHPQADDWLRTLRAAAEHAAPALAELVPLRAADTVAVSVATGPERQPTPQQRTEMAADEGIVKVTPSAESAPDFAQRFEAKHARKLGQLSPGILHAQRMANPLLKPIAERLAANAAEQQRLASLASGRVERDADGDDDPDIGPDPPVVMPEVMAGWIPAWLDPP